MHLIVKKDNSMKTVQSLKMCLNVKNKIKGSWNKILENLEFNPEIIEIQSWYVLHPFLQSIFHPSLELIVGIYSTLQEVPKSL